MKPSKKFYLSDLPEISSEIIPGEDKTITYQEQEYTYRIDKYSMYKDYVAVHVKGPKGRSAMTTCSRGHVKKRLKVLIGLLQHR